MKSTQCLLHIVAFNVPFPADYGGAIDVFYKIKTLAEAGARILLHCFQYGRQPAIELEKYCEQVYYYPRKILWLGVSPTLPYIISSRKSAQLLENLLHNTAPILFEGLHDCYYLTDKRLKNRLKIVRLHNIEWQYYRELAKAETHFFKRIYFLEEARRLRKFEAALQHADHLLPISPADTRYYQQHFEQVHYLPVFHPFDKLNIAVGRGKYALYHGNLSVSENIRAVIFLLEKVFDVPDFPLIIAGKNPPETLRRAVAGRKHLTLVANPPEETLQQLIGDAQVHILPTFQPTGIKLKLLHALFNGRFCLVNSPMVAQTGLEKYCILADDPAEMKHQLHLLWDKTFSDKEIAARKPLEWEFNNHRNAARLIELCRT